MALPLISVLAAHPPQTLHAVHDVRLHVYRLGVTLGRRIDGG